MFPFVSTTVKASPEWPPRMQTAIQLPGVFALGKLSDDEVVVPASLPRCCTNAIEELCAKLPKGRAKSKSTIAKKSKIRRERRMRRDTVMSESPEMVERKIADDD